MAARAGYADEPGHALQVERDRPYAEAVRGMITGLEERTGLSGLEYVLVIHRRTAKTHVHLLLRRESTSKGTGARERLSNRLPKEFLNSRDERGKAKTGHTGEASPASLDTLIPDRPRPRLCDTPAQPADGITARRHEQDRTGHKTRQQRRPETRREPARPAVTIGHPVPCFSTATGRIPAHGVRTRPGSSLTVSDLEAVPAGEAADARDQKK